VLVLVGLAQLFLAKACRLIYKHTYECIYTYVYACMYMYVYRQSAGVGWVRLAVFFGCT